MNTGILFTLVSLSGSRTVTPRHGHVPRNARRPRHTRCHGSVPLVCPVDADGFHVVDARCFFEKTLQLKRPVELPRAPRLARVTKGIAFASRKRDATVKTPLELRCRGTP